jgi:hypothetical protein
MLECTQERKDISTNTNNYPKPTYKYAVPAKLDNADNGPLE